MNGRLGLNKVGSESAALRAFSPLSPAATVPEASPQADIERALGASNSLFQLDLGADGAALKVRSIRGFAINSHIATYAPQVIGIYLNFIFWLQ